MLQRTLQRQVGKKKKTQKQEKIKTRKSQLCISLTYDLLSFLLTLGCDPGGNARPFLVDRDTNAGVNFALIDEQEARGELRHERFRSNGYTDRVQASI